MIKLIHLSDLHFHRHDHDNRAAREMLAFVQKTYPSHYLIVTGDITDDGHPDQYDNAAAALAPFKGRVFICPGNHDDGAAGNFYSLDRARRFDEKLSGPLGQGGFFSGANQPVVNVIKDGVGGAMLIGLDTNLETDHPFDFACGEVGENQIRALDSILANRAAHDFAKVLFFHHHPFMHNNPFMELKDARALWRAAYGRVDVVAFGHKHVSEQWPGFGGVQYVLAADNSPGKRFAREITIEGRRVSVIDVPIEVNVK